MKFPCWSDYDSVYDGVDLEIHVVDHCNLNCAGCNHFCSLAKPYYITPEYLREQLLLVKEKIPSLKILMLLGGEPTIHPQLPELCKIAREIFPDPKEVDIEILTNGKDLSVIIDNKETFLENNIRITLAYYDIEYNQEHVDELLKMKLSGVSWGRESFSQTLVDPTGSQDMENTFYRGCHHQLPCFTLRDFKIYECPFAAHIKAFKEKFDIEIPEYEGIDYLDLHTLTLDKLEEFSYQPKNICKYCKPGQGWIWHQSDRSYNEFTKTVNELYFEDYPTYEKIINLSNPSNNSLVRENIDPNFGLNVAGGRAARYEGKVDIIIPYYTMKRDMIEQLAKTLAQQTIIEDCAIYLISDNSPDEKEVFSYFNGKATHSNNKMHCFFLKNSERSGPGVARNKGIQNSFNKYIFFLDSDDELCTPTTLENFYNNAEYYHADALTAPRRKENSEHERMGQLDYFIRREYLENNGIKFGEFFVHEDMFFNLFNEILNKGKIIETMLDSTIYHQDHGDNIAHTIPSYVKAINKLFSYYYLLNELKEKNIENFNDYLKHYYTTIDDDLHSVLVDLYPDPTEEKKMEIQNLILFSTYILKKIFDLNPSAFDNNTEWTSVKSIKENDYDFQNFMIKTYEELEKYIIDMFESIEEENKVFVKFIKNYLFKKGENKNEIFIH